MGRVLRIVGTELVTDVTLPGSDDTYEVTVTYGADANIPEDATLDVKAIEKGSAKFEEAREEIISAKKAKDSNFEESSFRMAALDITILDSNGHPVEPADGAEVTVSIRVKNLPSESTEQTLYESMEVQHLNEIGDTTLVETVASVSDVKVANGEATADFTIDSFSTFALTWSDNSATIHWGSIEDGEWNEFDAASIDTSTGSFSLNSLYDNYTYVRSYYFASESAVDLTNEDASIDTQIKKTDAGIWQMLDDGSELYTDIADGSHIYAVYQLTSTIPETDLPAVVPAGTADPLKTSKTVVANKNADGTNDGTYKITLSVTGDIVQDSHTETSSANVIIVLDKSSSMKETLGSGTRLKAVTDAAKVLIDAMPNAASVEMALISFGGSVSYDSGTSSNRWVTINSDAVKTTLKNRATNLIQWVMLDKYTH